MFEPRPAQRAVLAYRGGRLGVVAVPGSGKTQTLSYLAADLVASGLLADDQEVLIVTLVNAAVNHFSSRVAGFLRERGLLPGVGYRVRTLHGLAHDIVRERPDLVGLADDFQIFDERAGDLLLEEVVTAWLQDHPDLAESFLAAELSPNRRDRIRRERWPALLVEVARAFIRQAKDLRLEPEAIAARLAAAGERRPLLEMNLALYRDYQEALRYRGAVDFDDLIRLAYRALEQDPAFLERLRRRWPFVLEDEAQDSSRLQEAILRLLVGPQGNWVRVGDPNQAIYETFTTASPRFLQGFLREPGVRALELPSSGRSQPGVIALANALIRWTSEAHPVEALRGALSPPFISPVPADDPQPNPPDDPAGVILSERTFTPHAEIEAVVASLERWLPAHPDWTVAVLVPRNERGHRLVDALRRRGLPHVDFLRSTTTTRLTAGALTHVLASLADPQSPQKLAKAYEVFRRADREDEQARERLVRAVRALRRCPRVEAFLWPRAGEDWLERSGLEEVEPALVEPLRAFREVARRWQRAARLPIDQLLLTVAQDLFEEPAQLALCDKLAGMLARLKQLHPDWRLGEFVTELKVIATNERRLGGFDDDATGFDPQRYRGRVLVTTIHKAKGLEWDRVYLMSVNNYDFPSAQLHDAYIGEPWFVQEGLNLQAEALAELERLLAPAPGEAAPGEATRRARLAYAAERLRLLYVGITRARRELVITANDGRDGRQQPALPLMALRAFWRDFSQKGEPL